MASRSLTASPNYETLFYPNDELQIEAYLYTPPGEGPFPVVMYNHGSRNGNERKEVHWKLIAGMLLDAGYAVFISERRGYGRSDGIPFSEAVTQQSDVIPRLEQEAGDVLAGVSALRARSMIDSNRLGLIGWSFGAVVSMLAAAREAATFRCVVNQAGGALTWRGNPSMRDALKAAARAIQVPVLSMDARNDATLDAVQAVDAERLSYRPPMASRLIVYPEFHPSAALASTAPNMPAGHLLFSQEGISIWKDDALAFLSQYLLKPT